VFRLSDIAYVNRMKSVALSLLVLLSQSLYANLRETVAAQGNFIRIEAFYRDALTRHDSLTKEELVAAYKKALVSFQKNLEESVEREHRADRKSQLREMGVIAQKRVEQVLALKASEVLAKEVDTLVGLRMIITELSIFVAESSNTRDTFLRHDRDGHTPQGALSTGTVAWLDEVYGQEAIDAVTGLGIALPKFIKEIDEDTVLLVPLLMEILPGEILAENVNVIEA
jgi:hypothetical protein